MVDGGDGEGVGRMVTMYERHTNLQEYVSGGGAFTGNIFRDLVPPIIFELSIALGMGQLPEPYLSMLALCNISYNPVHNMVCMANFLRCMMSKLDNELKLDKIKTFRGLLDFYTENVHSIRNIRTAVQTMRDQILVIYGSATPLYI